MRRSFGKTRKLSFLQYEAKTIKLNMIPENIKTTWYTKKFVKYPHPNLRAFLQKKIQIAFAKLFEVLNSFAFY
jgi:hypothetical protein